MTFDVQIERPNQWVEAHVKAEGDCAGRSREEKPQPCLLQKPTLGSFQKEGVVKCVKSNCSIKEDSTNRAIRFGNVEATSEGDLDTRSLGHVRHTSPTRVG